MANSNPQANKYSYIPPAVQKEMSRAMSRNMPQNLQKFKNSGAVMPEHIEKAMSEHMQKNLPKHMKQYADAYMQQNVIEVASNAGAARALRTSAPEAESNKPVNTNVLLPNKDNQRFNRQKSNVPQMQSFASAGSQGGGSSGGGEYDFILNPAKPPRQPLFDFSGASTMQKTALVVSGFILLIILFVVGSSFLNSANKAQAEKLLEIAQTQQEIVRITKSAEEKISSKDLLYKSKNVEKSVESSKLELIAELSKRGIKADEKKLSKGENSENDAILVQGEQNGTFDQSYTALLAKQLENYQILLKSTHDSSNSFEKEIIESAYNQIDLINARDN